VRGVSKEKGGLAQVEKRRGEFRSIRKRKVKSGVKSSFKFTQERVRGGWSKKKKKTEDSHKPGGGESGTNNTETITCKLRALLKNDPA